MSGSLIDRIRNRFSLQTQWRIACGFTTACAGLMAWHGVKSGLFMYTVMFTIGYWGCFLLLIGASFYIVLLDIRFVRLRYALERREIFRQMLGDEEFRRKLIEAQKKRAATQKNEPPPSE